MQVESRGYDGDKISSGRVLGSTAAAILKPLQVASALK